MYNNLYTCSRTCYALDLDEASDGAVGRGRVVTGAVGRGRVVTGAVGRGRRPSGIGSSAAADCDAAASNAA